MIELAALGDRICVMGPPGSGKSTLADAIGRRRGLPVVHLDRLYHLPGSDYVPRPAGEFLAAHDCAIAAGRWVIDGNYSGGLPQRLRRATGLILLDVTTTLSLWRVVRRALAPHRRVGGLEGGRDSVKCEMLHHVVGPARRNRGKYAEMFAALDLPKVRLGSPVMIDRAYGHWELERI